MVYAQNYLSASMTFVHRQLLGVADEFDTHVLASGLTNRDRFPFDRIHVEKRSTLEALAAKGIRRSTGRFIGMFAGRRERFRRVLLEHRVELVHAHFGPWGLEILPVAAALNIPLLVTFHGGDVSKQTRHAHYLARLRELFAYARIVAVSRTMAERLIELGADPSRTTTHYIGAPVDDFRFERRTPLEHKAARGEHVQFLQVANFVEKKGHRYTLEAFRDFRRHYPNSSLVLAGDGPLLPAMQRLARHLGLSQSVRFAGLASKRQVQASMREADAFLHHSVTAADGSQEGIPTVLMEAMATGLIVFSTRHAGIPELVTDRVTGYLVEERDVEAYTQSMLRALRHSAGIPDAAAAVVRERFNLRTQNEALKDIYRGALANR
jgi:glycosyltransferase involved in cell wall biosynthesis